MASDGLLRVCEWLSDEEFKLLLRVADYVGRSGGCSLFRLSPSKIARNYSLVDEAIELIKRAADDPMEALHVVDSVLREVSRVTVAMTDKGYVLTSARPLLELLRLRGVDGLRRWGSSGVLVPAYSLAEAVAVLREEGFTVDDRTGMLTCNELAGYRLRVNLRPYQEEALRAWMARRRGVIVLPTGAGKTVVALAAIVETACPTLVVVYTKEQLFQWIEKIKELTTIPSSRVAPFYGEEKRVADVTVATYQSVVRHLHTLRSRFKLLVVDEAHHLPAQRFREIALGSLAPYRMGLSATPYREDGLHEELFRLMGGIVYQKSVEELARSGYVAEFDVRIVRVQLRPDEKRVYRGLVDELSRLPDTRNPLELAMASPDQVKRAYQLVSRLRRFLSTTESKIEAAIRLVRDEAARGSKVIVFTEHVDVAERLARRLNGLLLTGKQREAQRRLVLQRFRRQRPAILVTTTVGDEGLDISDADVGVLLSPLVSRRQIVQRLGRLLRPVEGKVARLYVLVAKGTLEERKVREKLAALDEAAGR